MRHTTLLSILLPTLFGLAISLLPAALHAGADAREGRGRVYGQDAYRQPAYRGENHHPQAYLLASSGKRWEDMSRSEQEQIRRRKEKYESLPPGEKQRIREARERYERMPPERKEKIRERWEKMPADKKERYRLEKRER